LKEIVIMAEEEKAEKKLIIDEDWKKEAQKEKEVLVAQEKQEKEQAAEEATHGRSEPLPQGDLAALISMLTTQALFALGLLQVKGQDRREPDLELARYNIDMLETLEAKTKGNLTEDEATVLQNTLGELRMGYVHVAKQLESERGS
jgi:hypothetical protein